MGRNQAKEAKAGVCMSSAIPLRSPCKNILHREKQCKAGKSRQGVSRGINIGSPGLLHVCLPRHDCLMIHARESTTESCPCVA